MACVLALDSGTTSCRAMVFDEQARIVAVAQREFEQIFPRPAWVEHDPETIWQTQRDVTEAALGEAGLVAADVAAIGVTNQRETTVLWDRATGDPVHNAIVWQDRRTAEACDDLRRDHDSLVRERTGLVPDAYFSGTKVAWLLDHVDGARARAEAGELAFGTIDTWLLHRLTGGAAHTTDPSNASRTMLYDLQSGDWHDDLLAALRVPRGVLPSIAASGSVFGTVADPSALAGVSIAGMIGDQQSATLGQLCTRAGEAKNTYGTGCFLLMNIGQTPRPSSAGLLTTVAWQRDRDRCFALEGSVFIGGAIVQWLRDGLGIIESASEIGPLAASVGDADGVVLVPALAGLGAPYWDQRARGTIVGLTRGTTAAHIARAALDGIAHQVADLVEAMEADTPAPLTELRVDGGAAANDLLLQIQADLIQVPVVRPTVLETTALGAAYLAGLTAGVWSSIDELREHQQIDRTFEPQISADEARSRRGRWRAAVERSRDWA